MLWYLTAVYHHTIGNMSKQVYISLRYIAVHTAFENLINTPSQMLLNNYKLSLHLIVPLHLYTKIFAFF